MAVENIFSGKTVEDALKSALEKLGVTKEEVEFTVLEEAKSGFLGIGARQAKISVEIKKKAETLNNEDVISDFLKGLFEFLNINAEIQVEENENSFVVTLNSEDNASLIGYRGEILDSLQTLAGAVANKNKEVYKRVSINCEGYREKREETLKALAVKLADKAVAKGRKIKLEPMNPFERRIIHSAISDRTDVRTESEGKDPIRYVVIIPANFKKRGFSKDGRRNGRDSYKNKDRKLTQTSSAPRQRKSPFTSATFLGNSLKDNKD